MNEMNELERLYEEMRQKEQKRSESGGGDERIIKLKAGNTYRFRLLWVPNPQSGRKEPIINKYSHMHKDDEDSYEFITCPTSEYLLGKKGFNVCPVCKHMNEVYREYDKTKSPSAKEFYDLFKRQIAGYALVYVISDPTTPENNGKVKIFRHSFNIYKFLKWELFGIKIKGKGDDDKKGASEAEEQNAEIVGFKAFDTENGFDYILTVSAKPTILANGKKADFKDYSSKFSRNPTSIGVPMDKIKEMVAELRFDEEFYTKSSIEDLDKFLNNYVLPKQASDTGTSAKSLHEASYDVPAQKTAPAKPDDGDGLVSTPVQTAVPQPPKTAPALIERQQAAAPQEPKPASSAKASSEADVENILARINKDFATL